MSRRNFRLELAEAEAKILQQKFENIALREEIRFARKDERRKIAVMLLDEEKSE